MGYIAKLGGLVHGPLGSVMNEYVLCAVSVFILGLVIWSSHSRHGDVPRVGKAPGWFGLAAAKRDFILNGMRIIDEGYHNYKDSMFMVQTADMERIILSTKYLDELKSVPEDILSLRVGMSQRHLGKYTGLDIILTSHLQNEVCKSHLTQNLNKLIFPMQEETDFWLAQMMPDTNQSPAEINAYSASLRIVAAMTSRVFGGLTVSRDERWLRTAADYTLDVFRISMALRPYPSFLRGIVAPWLECTKRRDEHIKIATECFGGMFAKRLASHDADEVPNDNMVQWMVDAATDGDRNPDVLVRKLLFLTLAAVHTSTMSVTHAVFDLCAYPHYIEVLREEVLEMVKRHGWTLAGINNMITLDSFLKESQRVNHPGLLSFNRKVVRAFRLSDGVTIPPGSFISMATNSVARDSEYYASPDQFDGFRFYKQRLASPAEINKHQFVSTGPDSLPFGHGKFACPGRFYAAAQVKILLASVLIKYEISFGGGQTTRPRNIFAGESIGIDRTQTVVFKPRESKV
ncbi:putative Cytochrome P450 monooxygenase [Seiridium cardinale]|uniref:Cytochrome P450 monooxygenase n=1 Tax=Seiridium cardinale TaxID=138064 RepID=A0ABR2XMT0_9PEZI